MQELAAQNGWDLVDARDELRRLGFWRWLAGAAIRRPDPSRAR